MSVSQRTVSVLLFFLGALLSAAVSWTVLSPAPQRESPGLYTCPMHPEILREREGDCPICGMSLVSRSAPASRPSHPTTHVAIPSHLAQSISVRTSSVVKGPLRRSLRAYAQIQVDERRVTAVTTKFEGWIEKLYVHETGRFVRKGQPMLSIYSPKVVSGQQEYLLAKRQKNAILMDSARTRLLNWDLSSAQLRKLEARGAPLKAPKIHAPRSGFVFSKTAVQGEKIKPDQPLFRLVDLSSVWVHAQLYPQELPWLKLGQAAKLTLPHLPGKVFHGKVSLISPQVDRSSRTVTVRLELANPGHVLKPGMFGTVHIEAPPKPDATTIPEAAVLRSGRKDIAFVALSDGHYQPVLVKLGARGDEHRVEVLEGLRPGQRVVTSAQFLLDSQSQLQEALDKFSPRGPASRPAEQP